MNSDLQSGIIYQTKKYDKFKYNTGENRTVDLSHVKKYKKSIQLYGDYGELFPIVVDENFNIVDGQHRFTGRQELGLVIFYIQSIKLESKVLGGINDAMKKWTKNDFVEVSSDTEIVKTIEEIRKEINWEGLSYSSLIGCLSVNLKNILSADPVLVDKQMANLLRKKPLFVIYMKELVKKMTDKDTFYTRTSRYDILCRLANKLAKFGVSLDDIPTGTYDIIQTHLFAKGLIH